MHLYLDMNGIFSSDTVSAAVRFASTHALELGKGIVLLTDQLK